MIIFFKNEMHNMKQSLLVLIAFSILMSSCSLLKKEQQSAPLTQITKPAEPLKNSEKVSTTTSSTIKTPAESYIERFKIIAISEMNSSGIPASITLAQGILESGNGNSRLAKEANNHFGIKCSTEWKGETILQDDDNKDDCFRVYKSAEESFKDHTEFLKRKRYALLFELDKNDYRGWANGLKTAGYATNPRYAELLISLIERYELNRFDRIENKKDKTIREDKVMKEIAINIPTEKKQETIKSPVVMKIYEVRSGDTLISVSKQFTLSVADLKALNGLENESLFPGQLLLVSK
jgi:flagellum-specific peptidoglycan hydrolase FlgJ